MYVCQVKFTQIGESKYCQLNDLPISFTSPVTDHQSIDAAGNVLGVEAQNFWRDHKSSKVNAIRTKTFIDKCDLAIVRFGDKYKQWMKLLKRVTVLL